MRPSSYKYASLPTYKYQPVERHYQTFDFNTSSYYTYPISLPNDDDLTAAKVQDNKGPSAEQEKETPPADAAAEEPSASPDESSAAPENAGKCLTSKYDQCIHIQGRSCMMRTEVAHLRYPESSEPTPPTEPAEATDAPGGDAKEEGKEADAPAGDEPGPSAENEAPAAEAPEEPPAEGAESAEPEKTEEPSEPAADDSQPKKDDDNENNGKNISSSMMIGILTISQTKIFQSVTLSSDTTK